MPTVHKPAALKIILKFVILSLKLFLSCHLFSYNFQAFLAKLRTYVNLIFGQIFQN